MISEPKSLYVWIWLPGETEPVVAGQVVQQPDSNLIIFGYGRKYLANKNAISIFSADLPLQSGLISPVNQNDLAPSLRDALPDRWGRRVIVNELLGHKRDAINEDAFGEMTFMIASGSDRIGALDFQNRADTYTPRTHGEATLEELQNFASLIEAGEPVPEDINRAIQHGSSIGGARPKALIDDASGGHPKKLIAKFSASNDAFAMVKGEYTAMSLASKAGLNAAQVQIQKVLERDVLLVERFDRQLSENGKDWMRNHIVSALTWTQENEMASRHVAYTDLAEIIRTQFLNPEDDLSELFARLTYNILVGNTDDHARNHAAFWNGEKLNLTPAYDIAPQTRGATEVNQALQIYPGQRSAKLINAVQAAPYFHLNENAARSIIDQQVAAICDNWLETCDMAGMTYMEQEYFAGRQFLNSYAFEDFGVVPTLPKIGYTTPSP